MIIEGGCGVENPGDEVERLGERSHRVVIISLDSVPSKEGSARCDRSEITDSWRL